MRKVLLFLPILFFGITSAHADRNPFFGDYKHQVGLHLGIGVNSGFLVPPPSQFVPFGMAHIQYSLPTTFFEFPARYSLNIAQTIGMGKKYGWNWKEFSIPVVFISEDVALLDWKDWYFGAGAGIGFQAKENDRISSKLLFQFKLFAGYEISERFNIEAFVLHMSNGCTGLENHSYAWYGLGVVYKF